MEINLSLHNDHTFEEYNKASLYLIHLSIYNSSKFANDSIIALKGFYNFFIGTYIHHLGEDDVKADPSHEIIFNDFMRGRHLLDLRRKSVRDFNIIITR